ncbi:MAG TPA: hypothetical protein VGZ90_08665 [Puia sp.]|jgi:hypothetical protein|nr:hypothetical protein [Puia sp.]
MKAISTLVSLFLIVAAFAASIALYLKENYNLSAVLWIVWIISLTLWIKSAGMLLPNNKNVTRNA